MDELALLLTDDLITEYVRRRQSFFSDAASITTEVIRTHYNNLPSFHGTSISFAKELVKNIQEIQEQSLLKNKETSCDFNMLNLFHIGEIQHSYLLGYFLNHNAKHGQKHLFLNVFLDLLQIERLRDNENWIVTTEKGRIDILLKRVQPHSVIIIENKSNYANDQSHQLYRYWYQEIYNPILERNLEKDYILNPPEHLYQLIYLSPEHWKTPSTNTLTKPMEWDENLPEKVPLNPKHLLFSSFICEWLKRSLDLLPKENHRIREYVKQYIEYWN